MTFTSIRSFRVTPTRHLDRGLTLVFGSDGQVSLIGIDGGTVLKPPGALPTLTGGTAGTPTPGTKFLPSETTPASSTPNRVATSASLTGPTSAPPTPTSFAPFLTPSSYDPSSSSTVTDTNLPSIPAVNYPTPSPTAVSNPKDHDVGASFYLAIVLSALLFIGCVSAFIAWWIRSRARKRNFELDDPWHRCNTLSERGSPSVGNLDVFRRGRRTDLQTQHPYYLPASIVRQTSSNFLPASRTISDGMPQSPPSQSSRPNAVRLDTGLSVQESTRTLGRLRVANRVPGDVTSGDEGGVSLSRLQDNGGLSPAVNAGGPSSVGERVLMNPRIDQSVRGDDALLEPPGPATTSWGRRTDTAAALRRSRRRVPETTVQTLKNPKYGGYLYPTSDGGPSVMEQVPAPASQEEHKKAPAGLPSDPVGWKRTLKSSFWQAVDAVKGNRPSYPDSRVANVGSGSRFTPAPQRVASRRSPASLAHPATGLLFPDARPPPLEEAENMYELTVPGKSVAAEELVYSLPPRASRLNHDLGATTPLRPLETYTGSMYSTESAAARTNLRKYGYEDSIPSSWSALGVTREVQLDLDCIPASLRHGSSHGLLSVTPSQLALDSNLQSSSVSMRTRTSIRSGRDVICSDDGMSQSVRDVNTAAGHGEGSSYRTLRPSSTVLSMVNRKRGVTKRKRPKLPPRALSTASSIQSTESGLSTREVAVRRALLDRRKKVKAAESIKRRDGSIRSRDASSFLV